MLIEGSRVTKPPVRSPKWLWTLGTVLFGVILVAVALLATHWPFTEKAIIRALEAASGRPVQIRTFSKTYFPPGCIVEGIHFLRHKHPAGPPIITVEKLVVQGSIAGMLTSPERLSAVHIEGMRMVIPPKTPDEALAPVPLNSGSGGKALAISKITADGVMLEFLPEDRSRKSYLLKIDRLGITDVGPGTSMSYRATLTNSEPPGVIHSEGKFGPWNPNDVGATPVSGSFTYDNIDLSIFKSISGTGHARGQFGGLLARVQTHGTIDVSAFHVDGSPHSVQLATTFDATVNGTNGDVSLTPVVSRFLGTRIELRGSVGHEGGKGKTADFDVAVPKGRVEDLLYLFNKDAPGMSGDVTLNGKFLWPPGPLEFLREIRLDLAFGMAGSRFTNPNTQDSIDRLSESAGGESKKVQNEDPRTVLSQLSGNIQVRNGISAISNASFDVPGAHVTVRGTYNLLNQRVDLEGTLDTKGNLSDTTTGFKALVVKAITPLFKKKKSVRIVPFKITGSYGNTSVGIDWKR
ncbi:MAG: AsmA-like C-terminal region-containing protein [Candidatus Sulfopaludibacter sp.]|nr:AsmA-like C-terminal region-containing protein [Candidatus Sulfopaludibacter sp.]